MQIKRDFKEIGEEAASSSEFLASRAKIRFYILWPENIGCFIKKKCFRVGFRLGNFWWSNFTRNGITATHIKRQLISTVKKRQLNPHLFQTQTISN